MVEPSDPSATALKRRAREHMAAGHTAAAISTLMQATASSPGDSALWLNLAGLQRSIGDTAASLVSVDHALAAEPTSYLALLMKGSLLERSGQLKPAAIQYGRALAQVPAGVRLDAATAAALRHGREVYGRYLERLGRQVRVDVGLSDAQRGTTSSRRIDLFIDATLGVRRLYAQEPTDFRYPGLPAIEFHERDEFSWLPMLEAQTETIREELVDAIASAPARFTPYVAYPSGVPLDQWAELNLSPRWSAFHLYQRGVPVPGNAERCPQTMAMLAQLPQPSAPGRMPAAMFSLLRPKTRIPPHTGVANVRLVVHLPLIVPPGCGFRVGNETRVWREGEAWVFDDTIEHEAWNDSDQDRYLLIFDVWNPSLSQAEREMITAVMAAMDRYNDVSPDGSL